MLRCIFFLIALMPLIASAQPADPAPATETTPITPEMTPEQKLERYRHDQINLLALSPDAESLLAAALMADADAADKSRPAALKLPALLKRAQTVGENSPLVWWVTAAAECHGTAKTCPATETLQKLESLDAENAAVWTLSLWHAQQANDAPAARAALTSAAQAKHFNDYFGAVVAALYQAQDVLPMSQELLNATRQNASVSGYRLTTAAGIAAALAYPGGRAIFAACKPDLADTSVTADCLELAKKMEQSGSLNTKSVGLQLHAALLADGAELTGVRAHQRTLLWQMQRIGELAGLLASEERITRAYTQTLLESGDESAAVYAVLRSQGVPLEPPPDWQPAEPGAPLKP